VEAWFWVWVTLAAVLSIAEIFTGGFFLLPFGIGAAVAAAMSYAGLAVGWQWIAFIVVSGVLVAVTRPLARRITKESPQGVGSSRLIGARGVVVVTIDEGAGTGMVRVGREEWRADSVDDQRIEQGTAVVVSAVEGTHLVVRPAVTLDETAQVEQAG
jgi:membrane protein implicated in regulation of membrane protease activity